MKPQNQLIPAPTGFSQYKTVSVLRSLNFLNPTIQKISIATIFILMQFACSKSSTGGNGGNTGGTVYNPEISSVKPLSGFKNTTVTISGSHFGTDASKVTVTFNGVSATITSVADDQIETKVPAGAGTGIIKVTVNTKSVTGPQFSYIYNYTISLLAGSTEGFADGQGSAAQFGESAGLCSDASGNIYMVDYYNSRVRKITPSGLVSSVAGNGINGLGTGYADGVGTEALFAGPLGICMDAHGNFFISDTYNYLIREMTPAGKVTTIAGDPVTSGNTDGTGTAAKFYNPGGICADEDGNLYVADMNNDLIRKIAPGGVVTTLAGSIPGTFNLPNAVCVDANGNVFVSDSYNNRIRKVSPSGEVTTIAGSTAGHADGTGTAAQFNGITGICIDPYGNLFVSEGMNNDVRMISPAGEVTTIVSSNDFWVLSAICMDPSGNLYVIDMNNYQVKKLTRQ